MRLFGLAAQMVRAPMRSGSGDSSSDDRVQPARAFEKFVSFVFGRECGGGWVYAAPLCFFEGASQQRVVTAFCGYEPAHAVR